MTKTVRCRLLVLVLLLAPLAPAFAQTPAKPAAPAPFILPPPAPFPWWKSEQSRKELGLTPDQSAKIDKIWESTRVELRQEWDELSRLEEKLSRLIQNDADEAALSRQIDRVETARANANKSRSLMLVQMMKILTPAQRAGLSAIHERYLQEQQKQAPPPQKPSAPRSKQD